MIRVEEFNKLGNSGLNSVRIPYPDDLDSNDGILIPLHKPYEVRPADYDDYDAIVGPGKIDIICKTKARPPTAEVKNIILETTKDVCSVCLSALSYLAEYMESAATNEEYSEEGKLNAEVILHWHILSLHESMMAGCSLCTTISSHLGQRYLEYLLGWRSVQINLLLRLPCKFNALSSDSRPVRLTATVSNSTRPRTEETYQNVVTLRLWPSPKHDEVFLEDEADRAGDNIDGYMKIRGENTSSAKDTAIAWLDRCKLNDGGRHCICNAEMLSWYPTRLLDLRSAKPGGFVPIVYPANRPDLFASKPSYITLSHCWGDWGKTGLPKLLDGNKQRRADQGIPYFQLPQLFMDATEIAQWFQG